MKHILLLLVTGILISTMVTAQNSHEICGSALLEKYLRSENPEEFDAQQKLAEERVHQWIENQSLQRETQAVIQIPVVFHVVYRTSAENIANSYIMSQLQALNDDFNGTNSDINKVPSNFQSAIGNAEFEFCLATVDPQGNPTSGIIRKQTSKTVFNPGVKLSDLVAPYSSSTGGSDLWDPTQYLNIYSVNTGNASSGGTILGWAQRPDFRCCGQNDNSDGVVVNYQVIGRPSMNSTYSEGRNTTHEVGHWLGLLHVWGDANCGDDKVADTPTQAKDTQGCPSTTLSSCGSVDMYMNFMDYTQDKCKVMLSKGQVTRMRGFLNTDPRRSGILTSNGCGNGTPPTTDAGIFTISVPINNAEVACNQNVIPRVRVKNFGTAKLTSIDVNYQINNKNIVTKKWSGALSEGGLVLINLDPFQITESGAYNFKAWTANPNGTADSDGSNDKKTNTFTSNCSVGIDEAMNSGVRVFPNPAANQLYIELPASQNIAIDIYNLKGEWVSSSISNDALINVDLSKLDNGIYYLRLQDGKSLFTRKITVLK